MTRSGHIFYLLVALQLIGLMSQQVWGQSMDNEPMALVTTTSTTTVTTSNSDIFLDDSEQMSDTDLLDQDIEDEDDEDDDDTSDDSENTPPLANYFPLGQGDSKDLEQGDELGEELLVEYSDDDDVDDHAFGTNDGLMFEDDEAPLDFKNDEQVDLDQLLFDASQKDTTIMMEYDYQQEQQEQDNEDDTNDAMDELLANADDALMIDPLVDDDTEHPDHQLQEQQQQQSSPNVDENDLLPSSNNENNKNNHMGTSSLATENQPYHQSSSQYKIPLFGVLALLIILYKVSKKKQGGRFKCLEKEEKRLPLHTKDLKIPDIAVDCSVLVESSTSPLGTTTTQPSPTGGHHQLGRRASSSSFFSPRQATHGGNGTGSGGGVNGHARKISLGHPPTTGPPSKWEDKYRQ